MFPGKCFNFIVPFIISLGKLDELKENMDFSKEPLPRVSLSYPYIGTHRTGHLGKG